MDSSFFPPIAEPSAGPHFRPYMSLHHQVTKGRYITESDPRGYIPVYEYPLNGRWIMMDIDDGYILWTAIWEALGNSKADIVKMIDSQPDLAPVIRRVRGGHLKIRGTWMPYEVARRVSRHFAWPIRDHLIPLFGPAFSSTCFSPDQSDYGLIVSMASSPDKSTSTSPSQVLPGPLDHTIAAYHRSDQDNSYDILSIPHSYLPPHQLLETIPDGKYHDSENTADTK